MVVGTPALERYETKKIKRGKKIPAMPVFLFTTFNQELIAFLIFVVQITTQYASRRTANRTPDWVAAGNSGNASTRCRANRAA